MAKLPPLLEQAARTEVPSLTDYLINVGKVRNLYKHPDFPGQLLIVARNTLTIFDFVLPCLLQGHLMPSKTQPSFNAVLDWQAQFPDIPAGRALAIKELELFNYEFIFRMHLGGSVWQEYEETGTVAGQELPKGLTKWQKLSKPIFTPSTKRPDGHDQNIPTWQFFDETRRTGARQTVNMLMGLYEAFYAYAAHHDILILDTKFEAGRNIVADEVLTPDSSRFTTEEDFRAAERERRDPIFLDKQPVRDWGAKIETPFGVTGLKSLDPENSEHCAFVHSLTVPPEIIQQTQDRYEEIFRRFAGMNASQYQHHYMGLAS
ncbi:MAG: hypothetical protein NTV81_02680 [Candidatus Komeilibacteria bacterium]|nr:hypothetical protein [Candidatus Komeilibacteria bacterium]